MRILSTIFAVIVGLSCAPKYPKTKHYFINEPRSAEELIIGPHFGATNQGGAWCFDTKQGLKIFRAGGAPCPDKTAVERVTRRFLADRFLPRDFFKGRWVTFTDFIIMCGDVEAIGCIEATGTRMMVMLSGRLWAPEGYGSVLYHEMCHAYRVTKYGKLLGHENGPQCWDPRTPGL